jgi:hypothetical protein
VTPDGFRKLALSFPGTLEGEHMDHPDFRVRGKVFATIHPDDAWGVLMLTPRQQKEFVSGAPKAFGPVRGGWGRKGATQVLLKAVQPAMLRAALTLAWRNKAGEEPPVLN